MSKEVKQQLSKRVVVGYRSSEQISKVEVVVRYEEDDNCLQVEFPGNQMEEIQLMDITNMKVKDYNEDNRYRWILALNLSGGRQAQLQFNQREERDAWAGNLKSLVALARGEAAAALRADDPSTSEATNLAVKEVKLQEPRAGVAAAVKLVLAGGRDVLVEITEQSSSPDRIKQTMKDVVERNSINPAESTSLYRFLKTAVARVHLERETQAIVDEIASLHLDRLIEERTRAGQPLAQINIQEVLGEAKSCLRGISTEIPRRIGETGTSAAIVTQILRQNIDKMNVINDATARAYDAEAEVASKVTEAGW